MKASFHLYPGRSIDDISNVCKFLDENNFYSIYLSDHFMHHDVHVNVGNMIECWTGLAYIASKTDNIKISSFVSPLSFRHPGILANMAATVDEISKGRLILGVGAGWQENEHDAYGFDLLPPKERVDRFIEGVQSINGLLNIDNFSFNGKYFKFNQATCLPKKYNKSIPIMVGCWTGNPRMLSAAINYGDIINLIGDPFTLWNKLSEEFKYEIKFKNVLHHMILIDNFTKPLLCEYLNNNKNIFKPMTRSKHDFISIDVFKKYIKIYKKMNFSEIILGDASFIENEQYFTVINYMKNIIENE